MPARIIKSITFSVMMTLVMLISHGMRSSESRPIWIEMMVRFVLYGLFHFVICLLIDYIQQRRQGKGKHEV